MSSTSATVLSYEGKKLSHKVFYLQELNKSAGSTYSTRLLISEGRLIREVTVRQGGKLVRRRYVTQGPIAAVATTTEDQLEVDDETRRISIWIDESTEQTRRIIEGVWGRSSGVLTPEEEKVWHHVQRLLAVRARLPIVFPAWFPSLARLVGCGDLRLRRYAGAFKTACQTVCLIRSFRKPDEEIERTGKLQVNFIDVAIAQILFSDVLASSLGGREEREDEIVKAIKRLSAKNDGGPVQAWWIASDMGISLDRVYARIREGLRAGTIRRVNQPQPTNVKLYLPAPPRGFLPDPAVIYKKLGLRSRYRFIHPLTGKLVTYGQSPRGRLGNQFCSFGGFAEG
jgi:hypothetical protein